MKQIYFECWLLSQVVIPNFTLSALLRLKYFISSTLDQFFYGKSNFYLQQNNYYEPTKFVFLIGPNLIQLKTPNL